MNKRRLRFLIFTLLAITIVKPSMAQYEYIRTPQTPADIALLKKNNVMGETQWSQEYDKKLPYFTRAFDRQGRVVISADYYNRSYYLYDDKNNVVSFLDSFKTGDGFIVKEYKFQYDERGLLKEMKGPGMKSTFKYDPVKRILVETLVRNDTSFKNIYTYDDNLRLRDALFLDEKYKPYLHTMKNYSADGRIFNEVYATRNERGSDSTTTIYMYNDDKKLFKKKQFRFQNFYFNTKGEGKPNQSASHYDDATINYDLDEKGRPLAEEFTIKGDKINYRYNTWTYDANGLYVRETFKRGMAEPKIVVHEYVYY